MNNTLKILLLDVSNGFYRIERFALGDFFGPVDLGLFLSGKFNSLNIGTGLLAGSIIPGSNRLVFTGFSPSWSGFFVSSMGGAGLVFDNLGINMVSLINTSGSPSLLYLNRVHGEEIEVKLVPVDVRSVWKTGRGGVYAMMRHSLECFGGCYKTDPRILSVGPASLATDFGAIGSAPVVKGAITFVDTWAGRGGFGSKLLQEHGIASIIYGGTYIDEDFNNRQVADQWFQDKYEKKLAAKDFEATTKYRFDPKFGTGGTFGVNYAQLAGKLIAFNYKSIYLPEDDRLSIHKNFIVDHYLKQFNEETIAAKQQRTCGEPCAAVCKKMNGEYKKDYEPYQTLGPLCGIFDQRAAEKLNHHADLLGFDAISAGGVLSWLMECLSENLLTAADLGVKTAPVFSPDNFKIETDSLNNANLGIELLDAIIEKRIDLSQGARKFCRRLSREKGKVVLDKFAYNAFGRRGWMIPNQYWVPGVFSPMPIMGKYYMLYSYDFTEPRTLGRLHAERFKKELMLDNIGICRFHRNWAEEMVPEIVESLYGLKDKFLWNVSITASRINSRNASVFWESERTIDFIHAYLRRASEVDGNTGTELKKWLDRFNADKNEAALAYWYEIHKGIHESLREFN